MPPGRLEKDVGTVVQHQPPDHSGHFQRNCILMYHLLLTAPSASPQPCPAPLDHMKVSQVSKSSADAVLLSQPCGAAVFHQEACRWTTPTHHTVPDYLHPSDCIYPALCLFPPHSLPSLMPPDIPFYFSSEGIPITSDAQSYSAQLWKGIEPPLQGRNRLWTGSSWTGLVRLRQLEPDLIKNENPLFTQNTSPWCWRQAWPGGKA